MELRDYIKIYWQQRWLILLLVVVATAATWVFASSQPTRYGSSQAFAINRINRDTTPDYQFDGYYALQAADLFSQTVVSWFSTPSVLGEVYHEANIDPAIESLNSLPSRFKVKKYSAQNIVVRVTETSQTRVTKVAAAVKLVMEQKAAQLNQNPDGKSQFTIVGSDPIIAPVRPNAWLASLVALILSSGVSLFIAAARHYLRS